MEPAVRRGRQPGNCCGDAGGADAERGRVLHPRRKSKLMAEMAMRGLSNEAETLPLIEAKGWIVNRHCQTLQEGSTLLELTRWTLTVR
jgi:hypothetical protein